MKSSVMRTIGLRLAYAGIVAMLSAVAGQTQAAIINGVTASTDGGVFNDNFDISHITDGSGLSALDFSATHATTDGEGAGENHWGTNAVSGLSFPYTLTFDLGGLFSVDSIAVWNGINGDNLTTAGIRDLEIVASTDGLLYGDPISVSVNGGGATTVPALNPATGNASNTADILTFLSTSASHFRFTVRTVQEQNAIITAGVGEVAFNATSVPEPTTILLLGLGLAGLGFTRRRLH